MAQIKAYITLDKEGITEIEEQYFDIRPSVYEGNLYIDIPSRYKPQGVSEANAYQWSYDMSGIAQEIDTITSVYNLAFNTTLGDAVSMYTESVDNMFNGCAYLVDYTFMSDKQTYFNNTYRNTPNLTATVRIPEHVVCVDNCFASSAVKKVYVDGTPSYLNNCFYNTPKVSFVEFALDYSPVGYEGFLNTGKEDWNRLDVYLPYWRDYDHDNPTTTEINTLFKTKSSDIFGKSITWEYELAKDFGIYYNRDYQTYIHFGKPILSDRKGIFLNPVHSDSIIEAYNTGGIRQIV